MEDLALYVVETETERFYVVARLAKMDITKQLARALGLNMNDPLPKPLSVQRIAGRVTGRVKT